MLCQAYAQETCGQCLEISNGFYIDTTLANVGIAPQCLNIEITESDVMKNTDCSHSLLKSFRAKYMKVSIDDFGTGYSSLSYLHQFPFSHGFGA